MTKKPLQLMIALVACGAWLLAGSANAMPQAGEGDATETEQESLDAAPHPLTVLMAELNAEWLRAAEACIPAGDPREIRLSAIGDGQGGARIELGSITGAETSDPATDACLANELDGVEFSGAPHIQGEVLSVVVYLNSETGPSPGEAD